MLTSQPRTEDGGTTEHGITCIIEIPKEEIFFKIMIKSFSILLTDQTTVQKAKKSPTRIEQKN